MVSAFGLQPSWRGIAEACEPDRARWVGPSRHLQWSDEGRMVLAFGKNRGLPITELRTTDDLRGYCRWICERDFPPHVAQICGKAIELEESDLMRWVIERFGRPGGAAADARPRAE